VNSRNARCERCRRNDSGGNVQVLGTVELTSTALVMSAVIGAELRLIGGSFAGGIQPSERRQTEVQSAPSSAPTSTVSGDAGRVAVCPTATTTFTATSARSSGSSARRFYRVSCREHLQIGGHACCSAHGSAGTCWLDPGSVTISNGEQQSQRRHRVIATADQCAVGNVKLIVPTTASTVQATQNLNRHATPISGEWQFADAVRNESITLNSGSSIANTARARCSRLWAAPVALNGAVRSGRRPHCQRR